jgi:hypothetical protein
MRKIDWICKDLEDFADKLLDDGWDVYIPTNPIGPVAYMTFYQKQYGIGYCQSDRFGGFKFSSVHVPGQYVGTGYITAEVVEPSIDNAIDAAVTLCPYWDWINSKNVRKHKNIEHFLENRGIEYTKLEKE